MGAIYLIIHPEVVEVEAVKGNSSAQKVFAKLREIQKGDSPWLVLEDSTPSGNIHPDMPAPREDLEVLVCGAKGDLCVRTHQRMLLKRGYNARVFVDATYSDWMS